MNLPRVPCPHCGGVVEDVVPAREYALKDRANNVLANTNAKLEARMEAMKTAERNAVEADPLYPDAIAIFEYWRQKPTMPNAKELNDTRLSKVMARLHAGHSVDEIKLAIDGCEASTWHMRKKQNDLELICRDEQHLIQFQGYVEERASTTNGNGHHPEAKLSSRQVTRLEDRVQRLEREKRQLEERLADEHATSVAWRTSYHEALDYLETLKSPLATIAEDSVAQRFAEVPG